MVHSRYISWLILSILAMWNIFHGRCSTMRVCYQTSFNVHYWPAINFGNTASVHSLIDRAFSIVHCLWRRACLYQNDSGASWQYFVSLRKVEILLTAHWAVSQTRILSLTSGCKSIRFHHGCCLHLSPLVQQFSRKKVFLASVCKHFLFRTN